MLTLTRPSRTAAGSLLLAMLGIELGGNYILDLVQDKAPATEFQQTFARAGHGHAGALATLGLATIVLTDAAGLSGIRGHIARWAVPVSAVIMPAGFFFSSAGQGATKPNAFYPLIYVGAGTLATGLVVLGGSLLSESIRGTGSV
ncbi:hypothetical protein CGLAU_09610 [Corynebacterium glaucum]|uniref:Uncharacterized protein n=1 Tax=Corynebacterium glaucum TaxID=187491 RepID=A0A1Q2HYH1_9CORY|nr:hypothetical protein [Corynebacterium glaucum]AQQ15873.1 hypothetical protein CGLAU_09610 [Corynebacterium glaucum]WJZ08357.1 hypothetical protein CGLAUT_09410 [Corynebacterium glaucum]